MIASFFASQQTFCFLQLQAEKEAAAASSLKNRFRALDPTDAIITKVRSLDTWVELVQIPGNKKEMTNNILLLIWKSIYILQA